VPDQTLARDTAGALVVLVGEFAHPPVFVGGDGASADAADLAIRVCSGLQWASIAVGDDPQVGGAV
jgi:hypothetical protein